MDSRGLIPILTYIKIHISFLRNGYDLRNWGEKSHVDKRRELLKAGDVKGYETEVSDRLTALRVKTAGMQKYAFAELKLPEQAWPSNAQYFMSNPQLKA